jgi:hypothetical protein
MKTPGRPPFYIADLIRIFSDNPEGLAIVLTYYSMPREIVFTVLDNSIEEFLAFPNDEGKVKAANTLIDIRNCIEKTTPEEHEFIQNWIKTRTKDKLA